MKKLLLMIASAFMLISCSACDVDISDLKKGLYIIRALIGDEILNEKITIQ